MRQKFFLFLALLCMVAQGAWAASGSWSDEANRDLTWGTNYESASSFTIENAAQMAQFAYMVNNKKDFEGKTITLANDIDLSAHYWVPIGSRASSDQWFVGSFDGANHTVSGMMINDPNCHFMGLFGYNRFAASKENKICRLKLANSTLTGSSDVASDVGGIVGWNAGMIEDCHVLSNVTLHFGKNDSRWYGGIAGQNVGEKSESKAVIRYCSSQVSIVNDGFTGAAFCGGITGNNSDAEVVNSLYMGENLAGDEFVGTITGDNGTGGSLSYNYYRTLTDSSLKGVGQDGTRNGVDIDKRTYPAKIVTFGDEGFLFRGNLLNDGYIKYYDCAMVFDGVIYSGKGIDFAFSHTTPAAGYDYSINVSDPSAELDDTHRGRYWIKIGDNDLTLSFTSNKVFDGEGTEESPFLIKNIADMNKLSEISNGVLQINFEDHYFKLETDLTYDGTENNFMPISHRFGRQSYSDEPSFVRFFEGHFDGNGHTISGLNVKDEENDGDSYVGVFGKARNGSIKNLKVTNCTFKGSDYIGGIAGHIRGEVVENCHVTNTVTLAPRNSSIMDVGGIVGEGGGTIKGCTCAATIVFPAKNGYANEVGGIAGYFGGTMQDCLYYGDATAFYYYDADPQNQNEYDHSRIGTLVGRATNDLALSRNLYVKEKAKLAAIGTDYFEGSDKDGASGAYIMTINQPEYLGNTLDLISLTSAPAATYTEFENLPQLKAYDGVIDLNGTYYAKTNATIALTTGDKYRATLSVETAEVTNNTFTMPEADVTVTATDIARKEWGGSGTEADPYTIANVAAMNALAEEVNGSNTAACFSGQYFKMTADIDYSNENSTKDGGYSNFSPVGYMNSEKRGRPFSGVFDGGGHTLSGININRPTDGRITQGVFGLIGDDIETSGPVVKNLKLANSTIVAIDNTYVGGIVGVIFIKGLVENCEVASDVRFGIHSGENPSKVFIGGIVGANQSSNSTISNCFSEANFDLGKEAHAYNTGAIIGLNDGGTLTKNYYRVSNAKVKGVGAANIFTGTDVDGANAALALTFNEVDGGTSSTDTEATVTHNGTGYFIAGNAVNLKYEGTYKGNGYTFSTDSEGATVSGNTLTVGTEDVVINTSINISLSNTESNEDILNAMKHSVNVTLKDRTLYKDDTWNTLCLPFSLTAEQLADNGCPLKGATVKTLESTSFTGGTLTLNFSDDLTSIEAGKPYIVKWDGTWFSSNPIQNPTFSNTTISATEAQAIKTTYTDFVGTFSPVTLEANDKSVLFLGANNKLYYPSANVLVNSCRAYFKLNGLTAGEITSDAIQLNFGEDEATGVISIENGKLKIENDADAWYSLDGRRLSGKPTQKGIYINHGNKVVIK